MTPEELKHAAEVMTAAANGATIEQAFYNDSGPGPWCVEDDPVWDWNTYNYRVKHEPIEITVKITHEAISGLSSRVVAFFNSDEVRLRLALGESMCYKFREVTDGS